MNLGRSRGSLVQGGTGGSGGPGASGGPGGTGQGPNIPIYDSVVHLTDPHATSMFFHGL